MTDDYLIEIYNSLVEDEISKSLIKLINQKSIQSEEDFENLLGECLDLFEKVD